MGRAAHRRSTGKHGVGIVPIADEPLLDPASYRDDRLFVYLRLAGADNNALDAHCAALVQAGHPVVALPLQGVYDLGGEFYRWEFATAVAGQRLGINTFDQPNVEAAKEHARRTLERYAKERALPEEPPALMDGDMRLYGPNMDTSHAATYLGEFLSQAGEHDYVAVMAYIDRTDAHEASLQALRSAIAARTRLATTIGFGPRYLHSTGQLHKGGPNTGLFLLITQDDAVDLEVPDAGYTFGVMKQAQALGDLDALRDAKRRVVRVQSRATLRLGSTRCGLRSRPPSPREGARHASPRGGAGCGSRAVVHRARSVPRAAGALPSAARAASRWLSTAGQSGRVASR